jgi:hypothetical protein
VTGGRFVGRHEILEETCRGGMARVHLARQLDLDVLLAEMVNAGNGRSAASG